MHDIAPPSPCPFLTHAIVSVFHLPHLSFSPNCTIASRHHRSSGRETWKRVISSLRRLYGEPPRRLTSHTAQICNTYERNHVCSGLTRARTLWKHNASDHYIGGSIKSAQLLQ